VAYARFDQTESMVVVVNHGEAKCDVQIPVWIAEIPMEAELEQLLYTSEGGYVADKAKFPVDDGVLTLDMGKTSATILRYKK
jgi:alpha-glucosidase